MPGAESNYYVFHAPTTCKRCFRPPASGSPWSDCFSSAPIGIRHGGNLERENVLASKRMGLTSIQLKPHFLMWDFHFKDKFRRIFGVNSL
jgi:hypothetical protein